MQNLVALDLTADVAASLYVKDEIVEVTFAVNDGEIITRVGPNHYHAGDALITGSTGDRWSVSRERFEAKYVAVAPTGAGCNGRYRARPIAVWAKQMSEAFTIVREAGGDLLSGETNDWLLQYAPGDFGVAENARFVRVYRLQQLSDERET
jgi:hypothetical protein